jgi:hypothetical protein
MVVLPDPDAIQAVARQRILRIVFDDEHVPLPPAKNAGDVQAGMAAGLIFWFGWGSFLVLKVSHSLGFRCSARTSRKKVRNALS